MISEVKGNLVTVNAVPGCQASVLNNVLTTFSSVYEETSLFKTSPTRHQQRSFMLSPIDITHLGSSRCSSVENLSEGTDFQTAGGGIPAAVENYSNSLPRSFRRRWSRKSLRQEHLLTNSDSGNFSTKA